MKEKLIALLTFTSSLKSFGMKFIRVAILIVFVWIGGLKYFHHLPCLLEQPERILMKRAMEPESIENM